MALHRDSWLSQILGYDAFKADARELLKTGFKNDFLKRTFVFSKVGTDESEVIRFVENAGFRLADTNVTFEKTVFKKEVFKSETAIRFARNGDESGVVEVARNSFHFDRFHTDGAFKKDIADTIKAEWVRNFFKGSRGDAMIVAEADGKIAGFLQMLKKDEKTWIIDLIGVSKAQRRKGIAQSMISFAENSLKDCETLIVGTQIANIPSMRLYENLGFRVKSAEYVFHFHHE